MERTHISFRAFWWRVVATHTLSYFVIGLLAFVLFDYRHLYAETELRHLMLPTSSPWVAAGPGLQLVRGTVFAIVLWPLVETLRSRSSLILYGLLVGLAILGAAGPSPGSLEGVWFTQLPLWLHAVGLPEVLLQTAVFAWVLSRWLRKPTRWMTVVSIVGVLLVEVFSLLGVLDAVYGL